jgi:ribosomal protein L40E
MDALLVRFLQHAAEGGGIGQTLESEETLNHGIVAVGPAIPQFAEAEQEMDDELEEDRRAAIDLARGQVTEDCSALSPMVAKNCRKRTNPAKEVRLILNFNCGMTWA